MPIDSERKRRSVTTVAQFGKPRKIKPDGSLIRGDRQQIGWNYYGTLTPVSGGGSRDTKLLLMFVGR